MKWCCLLERLPIQSRSSHHRPSGRSLAHMTTLETQPSRPTFGGLDYLRVAAVALVTIQHAAAILGDTTWMTWGGINVGQLGVGIFLAISGFLASQSRQPAMTWLFQRLRRIYPAFWIVMAISFWLTWLTGYKQFDIFQVISQMLGLGLFTHPEHLVNTATWFISLLLVCYLGVFVARVLKAPVAIGVASSLGLLVCAFWVADPAFVVHLLTFSVAFTSGEKVPTATVSRRLMVAGALALAVGISHEQLFIGTGLSLIAVGLALRVSETPRFIRSMADVSYEYYLLHGVVLVGVLRYFPGPITFRVLAALLIAVIAAKCLRSLTQRVERRTGERRAV